jgi:hypothetical protein
MPEAGLAAALQRLTIGRYAGATPSGLETRSLP